MGARALWGILIVVAAVSAVAVQWHYAEEFEGADLFISDDAGTEQEDLLEIRKNEEERLQELSAAGQAAGERSPEAQPAADKPGTGKENPPVGEDASDGEKPREPAAEPDATPVDGGAAPGAAETASQGTGEPGTAEEFFAAAEKLEDQGLYSEAALNYMRAINLGHAEALNSLGILYLQGAGVEENYERALMLFQEAKKRGCASADRSLGFMYRTGRGVPMDLDRALEHYLAAEKAVSDAMTENEIGTIYQSRGGDENYRLAVEWYEKAAVKDNEQALYNLALILKEGKGVPRDPERSVKLLRRAAVKGLAYAQHDLGAAYGAGDGIEKDLVQMYAWFTAAGHAIEASLEYRGMLGSLMTEEQRSEGEAIGQEYYSRFGSHE